MRRLDYFLGKLGVIAALVAGVAVLPAVAAYVLGVCFSLDLTVIRDTWRLLPASILYGLIIVVSAGTLMLAMSSLSRRSLYVGMAWVGLWIISAAVAAVLDGIQREAFFRSIRQEEAGRGNVQQTDVSRGPDERALERNRWNGRMSGEMRQRLRERVGQAEAEAAPGNWRPLCSYTANLQRLGEALLNTDAAWVEIGRAVEVPRAVLTPFFGRGGPAAGPGQINNRRLADQLVPQYPWIWSAGVLAGLLGLSLCTLSTRVKSLDRLR